MITSASALSQIETALLPIRPRVSSRMKAPPPVAITAGPLSSSRAITRASPSLKYGSPWVSKMSGIDIPAAASISISASRNGSRNRVDNRRPMVDLPAPIMPTSTTERVPSAALMSASWDALVLAGEAVSGIKIALSPRIAALCVTYTTAADTVARGSCNEGGNMLVVSLGRPRSFQWLTRRLRLAHAQPVPLSDGRRRDRRDRLWRDLRAGEFCKSEAAGNDRHNSGRPVPQEVEDR